MAPGWAATDHMHPAADSAKSKATTSPRCPRCEGAPPLERYPRYEVVTFDPLRFCQRCYGFWAVGDALSRGMADDRDSHPALTAAPAPRGCRECGAPPRVEADDCQRCGASLLGEPLPCPACGEAMQRHPKATFHVDTCEPCGGTWFDVGELGVVFGRLPQQGLAAATVDENAPDQVPHVLLEIAFILLRRLFLPF